MVIHKKVRRTMLESKAQYFGSLALIIISCLLYTMFNQLSFNMGAISSDFESHYVQEDANFMTDKPLFNLFDLENKLNMRLEEGKMFDYSVSADKTLRIFSESTKVNLYAVTDGERLTGKDDILIDPAYAKANAIKIGDQMLIEGKSFKVVGFMSLPNYIYPLKKETDLLNDPIHFGIAVMGQGAFSDFHKGSHFYSVKVLGDKDEASKDAALVELKAALAGSNAVIMKWTNITENPRVSYVTAKMESMKKAGSILPIAILLLTCVLTGVVMRRMLKREAMIIGTLYAQGYRKSEIMKHYLQYPLWIALVGGIVGTLLGAAALPPMLNFMISYFNMPIDAIHFSVVYLMVSLVLPLVFLIGSVYLVVRKSLTYSPIELMRGGKESSKVGFIERRLNLNKLKFASKFKLREQLRSLPRSLFLLIGVALATMLLLLGFTMKSSMDFILKDTYESAYKYQHEYVFNTLQQGSPSSGETFSMAPFMEHPEDTRSFLAYGVRPDSTSLTFQNMAGEPLKFDKVIVTKPLADRMKLHPHDSIQVVGKLDSKPYTIQIDEIANSYIGEYLYMPLTAFNALLGYPKDSYLGIWSQKELSLPETSLLSSSTIEERKAAFDSLTQPLQVMLGAISLIAFMIGMIVIYVVTSLIIEENKENISLMKVLGYRKKEVYALILNSSTYIVVLGYVVGVPLLLVSLKAMYQSIADSTSFVLPVTINYGFVAFGFIVIYLIFELTKALSKKKINRISMSEVLKSRAE